MTNEQDQAHNIAGQKINIYDLGEVIKKQARITKVMVGLLIVLATLMVGFAVLISQLSGNIDQNTNNITGAQVAAIDAKAAAEKADKDLEAALKASSDPKYRNAVLSALDSVHRIEQKLDEHVKANP